MIAETRGWKAFRLDSQGRLRFLFHAYKEPGAAKGSSLVPMDRWITTKRPWGSEGQRSRQYRLGFHFLRDAEKVEPFKRLTKNKYIFLPVRVREAEPKPRTSVGSWLARHIYVSSRDFARAIEARKVLS